MCEDLYKLHLADAFDSLPFWFSNPRRNIVLRIAEKLSQTDIKSFPENTQQELRDFKECGDDTDCRFLFLYNLWIKQILGYDSPLYKFLNQQESIELAKQDLSLIDLVQIIFARYWNNKLSKQDINRLLECLLPLLSTRLQETDETGNQHEIDKTLASSFLNLLQSKHENTPLFRTTFEETSKCTNSSDQISLEEWKDIPDVDKIIIYSEDGKYGYCYTKSGLLQSLLSTIVYKWPRTQYDIPYYKLPYPSVFIDLNGLITLFEFNKDQPTPGIFHLSWTAKQNLGTAYEASAIHGEWIDVYTILEGHPTLRRRQESEREETKRKRKIEDSTSQKNPKRIRTCVDLVEHYITILQPQTDYIIERQNIKEDESLYQQIAEFKTDNPWLVKVYDSLQSSSAKQTWKDASLLDPLNVCMQIQKGYPVLFENIINLAVPLPETTEYQLSYLSRMGTNDRLLINIKPIGENQYRIRTGIIDGRDLRWRLEIQSLF